MANRGGKATNNQLIKIDFDRPLKELAESFSPKVVVKAMRRTLKRSADSAVLGARSTAMKTAFGRGGVYAITAAKAKAAGVLKGTFAVLRENQGHFLAQAVLTGRALNLAHFPQRVKKELTPVGPSGTPRTRPVLRVKVMNKKGFKTARRGSATNVAKRWPHPRLEFIGFPMVGNAGSVAGAGANLVVARYKEPKRPGSRKDRKPVRSMYTIDPAHMAVGKHTITAIQETFRQRLPIEFAANMKYYAKARGAGS